MPMQPSPMAETSRLSFPRYRFCIASPFRTSGDELDRRGSRFWADHELDVVRVAAVLLAIGFVNRVVDRIVGVDEGDVLVDAPGADASFVTVLGGEVPAAGAP